MSVNNVQLENKSDSVILPRKDYEVLIEKAEAYDDLMAVSSVKQAIARGEEELIPQEMVDRLLKGDSPIQVWRQYRGLSQQMLAESVGVSQAYIAQLEAGQRQGKPALFKKLAEALSVSVDDLI